MIDGANIRLALVSELLKRLDNNSVRHVVLRNHEEIASGQEKDIDFLMDVHCFGEARRIAQQVAAQYNAKVVLDRVCLEGAYITIAFPENLETRAVRLHLNPYVSVHTSPTQLRLRGISTRIRCRQISRDSLTVGGLSFWVPSPDWSTLFLSARLLRKNKEKYLGKIQQLSSSCTVIQKSTIDGIVTAAKSDDAIGLASALQQALRELSPLGLRFRGASEWMQLVASSLKSSLKRHGPIIIFSGPDGAGKSTTTAMCARYLKDEIGTKVHFVKGLAPINNAFSRQLLWVHNKIRAVPSNVSSAEVDLHHRDRPPKDKAMKWKMRRLLGLLFYILQYWPAYAFARLRNHFGEAVIVDTSVHDRFVKAHRPRFPILERIFVPSLPVGDLLIQLRAPSKLINARKPELTVEEIDEYYSSMDSILPSRPEVKRIATDSGPELAARELKAHIISTINPY